MEVTHGFVPRSFAVWFGAQWIFLAIVADVARLFLKKSRTTTLTPQLIAQHALSVAHTWLQMSFCITYVYRAWIGLDDGFVENTLADWGIGLSISYFVVDAILILLIDLKNQWSFLIHHAFALFIGTCMSRRISSLSATTHYMFVIEMSNAFISVWDLLKRHHRGAVYDAITPVFALTYVPFRTVGLTIVTINFIGSLNLLSGSPQELHQNTQLTYELWASVLFVLMISWNFSRKIASIGLRSARANFPGILTFESLTYVFKAYVNLVWFVWILPYSDRPWSIPLGFAVLLIDAIHIAASLYYWIHENSHRPVSYYSTASDFHAICLKIVANGIYIYLRAYLDGNGANKMWSYFVAINVGILIQDVYDSFIHRMHVYECFERRDPQPFLKHYILSAAVPLIMMPTGTAPYTAVAIYFIGGAIWYMFPKNRASVGWMHLCVTVGDVALLWWGSFF
jgi:hypothetical protein